MKPIDVASDSYADYNEDSNKKNPKFKVVIVLEFQNIKKNFAKRYVPNWSEEVFVVSKIKNTASWTYVISDLNGELIAKTFYQK